MALAPEELRRRARGIRLAVFDVDGVLTDGRLILGPDGQVHKAFHVRDGGRGAVREICDLLLGAGAGR